MACFTQLRLGFLQSIAGFCKFAVEAIVSQGRKHPGCFGCIKLALLLVQAAECFTYGIYLGFKTTQRGYLLIMCFYSLALGLCFAGFFPTSLLQFFAVCIILGSINCARFKGSIQFTLLLFKIAKSSCQRVDFIEHSLECISRTGSSVRR